MYSSLTVGQRIPCPTNFGRGTHVLLLDSDQGELFCHCIHLKHKVRKTDKVVVSRGRVLAEGDANRAYVLWRNEVFAKAESYQA